MGREDENVFGLQPRENDQVGGTEMPVYRGKISTLENWRTSGLAICTGKPISTTGAGSLETTTATDALATPVESRAETVTLVVPTSAVPGVPWKVAWSEENCSHDGRPDAV
jgi:hypothetical protein